MSVRDQGMNQFEKIAGNARDGAIRLDPDDAIRLAHRVLERFPGTRKKHMFIAGGAALSSAVLIGAAVAIARRVRQGQNAEEAAEEITEDELANLSLLERRRRPPREAAEPEAADAPESPAAEDAAETPAGDQPDAPAASHG